MNSLNLLINQVIIKAYYDNYNYKQHKNMTVKEK